MGTSERGDRDQEEDPTDYYKGVFHAMQNARREETVNFADNINDGSDENF